MLLESWCIGDDWEGILSTYFVSIEFYGISNWFTEFHRILKNYIKFCTNENPTPGQLKVFKESNDPKFDAQTNNKILILEI
jgi:hypothetical protein